MEYDSDGIWVAKNPCLSFDSGPPVENGSVPTLVEPGHNLSGKGPQDPLGGVRAVEYAVDLSCVPLDGVLDTDDLIRRLAPTFPPAGIEAVTNVCLTALEDYIYCRSREFSAHVSIGAVVNWRGAVPDLKLVIGSNELLQVSDVAALARRIESASHGRVVMSLRRLEALVLLPTVLSDVEDLLDGWDPDGASEDGGSVTLLGASVEGEMRVAVSWVVDSKYLADYRICGLNDLPSLALARAFRHYVSVGGVDDDLHQARRAVEEVLAAAGTCSVVDGRTGTGGGDLVLVKSTRRSRAEALREVEG